LVIASSTLTGLGPTSFTLKAKNGLIYEYGATADSRLIPGTSSTVLRWLLDSVSDRYGNKMVISYDSTNGVPAPKTIRWSPTTAGGSTYQYTMTLSYTAKTAVDSVTSSVAGQSLSDANRLDRIKVESSASGSAITVRKYVLGYQTSTVTNLSRLAQIKECADNAETDCLGPTVIAYQDGSGGVAATVTNTTIGTNTFIEDINGDGRDDLLYLSGGTWYVAFAGSTPGTYGAPVSTGATGSGPQVFIRANFFVGDLFGSGAVGLFANKSGVWWYYWWNNATNSFSSATTNITVASTGIVRLVDVNGDGRDDIVYLDASGNVYRRLNTSAATTPSFASATSGYSLVSANSNGYLLSYWVNPVHPRHLDFNGDGLEDFVATRSLTNGFIETVLVLSTTGSFSTGAVYPEGSEPTSYGYFNSDKCVDLVTAANKIQVSSCDGHNAATISINAATPILGMMDWDGDGRADVLVSSSGTLGVYPSLGSQVGTLIQTSLAYAGATAIDQDGDGLMDLANIGSGTVSVRLHALANQQPDLATAITDAFGKNCQPAYISTANGAYAKGVGTTYPQKDAVDIVVVQKMTCSDGVGGTYSRTYSYAGARIDQNGRDFVGFQQRNEFDSRNGLTKKTFYRQDFPYIGMVYQEDNFQPNGTSLISHTTYTPASNTLDSTANNQRYFPYINASTSQSYEVGGNKNTQLIITESANYTYDASGNLTGATITDTDNDSTAPISPYNNQVWTTVFAGTYTPDASQANWCLTVPSQLTLTRSSTSAVAITRTIGFTPNYTKCRVDQRVVEPNPPNSTKYKISNDLLYDSYGNLSSDTVTGINMTPRVTGIYWGPTGQFPKTITNALSQVTQLDYDYDKGVRKSITDPNGIQTAWEYDSFARQNKETRPNGTYKTTSYGPCDATTNYCGTGNTSTDLRMETYFKNYAFNGALIDQQYVSVDSDTRSRFKKHTDLAGDWIVEQTQYDALGRVSAQSMPYKATAYFRSYSYDLLDRMTQTQRPKNSSDSTPVTTTYSYLGRTTKITDPLNNITTRITQVSGQLGRSQDQNNYYQDFSYDAFGSLLSIKDSVNPAVPLLSATYDYGYTAFQRTANDVDLGNFTYTYDALGELTTSTDAKNQTATFSSPDPNSAYDRLGRPVTRTERLVSGAADLTTTWAWGNSAAAYNIGQLASVTSTAGALTYTVAQTYNAKGQIINEAITPSPIGQQNYDFTYNSAGQLDTLTYPTSTSYRLKLQYGYANGYLQTIKDYAVPTTVFWTANTENPFGEITQETLGTAPTPVIINRSFDLVTGLMSTAQAGLNGGAGLQNQSYLYDTVGNVTLRQNNALGLNESACYDNLYRLDHTTATGVCTGTASLQMSYDLRGNIVSRTGVGSYDYTTAQAGCSYAGLSSQPHAVRNAGGRVYCYDANGNVISRNGASINWTSYNYPAIINGSGESASFDYGPEHQYWRQTYTGSPGNETTYYIGALMERVDTSNGSDYRHYIVSDSGAVAIYSRTSGVNGTNTLRYVLSDHQGSPSSILTSAGAVYVNESFEPFGSRRNPSSWSGPPVSGDVTLFNGVSRTGYIGQTMLGSMGLIHMNGRVQDSIIGRFLSPDPLVTEPDNTQSYNRYSYVNENPLTFIDPSGFSSQPDPDSTDKSCEQSPAGPPVGCGPGNPFTSTFPLFDTGRDDSGAPEEIFVTGTRKQDSAGGVSTSRHDILDEMGGDIMMLFGRTFDCGLLSAQPGLDCSLNAFKRDANGAAKQAASLIVVPEAKIAAVMEEVVITATRVVEAARGALVIGRGAKFAEPGALRAGEYSLKWESKLPNFKAEWAENASRLREAMGRGNPIRDISPGDTGGMFLNAERNLLRDRGRTFDAQSNYWLPPK
jgi:RHS repeat-associated protein